MKKEIKVTVEPMGKYLLVKRDTVEDKSQGGIILPAMAQRKPNQGTIHGVGPRCEQKWNLGDVIIFNELGSFEVSDGTENLLLLTEDMVFVRFK